MIQYQVRYADVYGATICYIPDFLQCEYVVRADGKVGGMQIVLPKYYRSIANSNTVDYRLSVYKSINGSPFVIDGSTEFLTRKWDTDDNTITVYADSLQSLLTRRIIAYPANVLTFSKFSDFAGNICKRIMSTNFGSAIAAARDGSEINADISSLLTISADTNDGMPIQISCSRRNVADAIESICNASYENGIWMVGLITSNGDQWRFETYANYYGVYRPAVLFSPDIGNVQNVKISFDLTEQKTFIVAGGQGQEAARIITSAYSSSGLAASFLNRNEYFYQNTQVNNVTYLQALASQELRAMRGVQSFDCELVQTPSSIRGLHYNLGDVLQVQFDSQRYTMRLDQVQVSIGQSGVNEKAVLNTP